MTGEVSGRKHRWTRRILLGVVALLALVVLGSWAFIKFQPTLAKPVELGSSFASGATVNRTAPGRLAMNGVTHLVTATVSARRDGAALEAAGSIPVTFSAWGIKGPAGYGFFAGIANHGTAEFLISAHRL